MECNKDKPMKVVIYTRVSTEEQVEGYSLTYQQDLCKEYCQKQGWEVVRTFEERGESAKTANRPQLLELLDFARKNKGGVDIILVHKLDRVARNTVDHHGIRAALTRFNIVLRSVSEPIDESPQGKFMETIYAGVAQLDNDVRAERTKEGLKERVRQGLWAWKAPVGYLNTPIGMSVDTDKAPLIRKAFETYAMTGYTIRDIAQKLNRWGLRTSKGKKLTPQSVDHIFRNKLYMGVIEVKGWKDEVQGLHEKIVEPELFYRVQAVREGKSFTAVPRLVHKPDFPLKNIARCDSCGEYLTGSWSRGRNKKYAYYHCLCGKTRFAKSVLEESFYTMLKGIQPNSAFTKLFKAVLCDVWKQKQADKLSAVNRITKEVDKLRDMKERLLQKNLAGVVVDEDYRVMREKLDSEIAVKEVERSECRSEETNIEYLVSLSESLLNNTSTIWLDAPFEHKLRFQALMFPKGIRCKDQSIGIVELGLPFALIGDAAASKTNLVPPAGFEPAIHGLKTRCPRPLDEGGDTRHTSKYICLRKRTSLFYQN